MKHILESVSIIFMWSENKLNSKCGLPTDCDQTRNHPRSVKFQGENIQGEGKALNSSVKSPDELNQIKHNHHVPMLKRMNPESSGRLNFCVDHEGFCFTTSSKVRLRNGELRSIGSITKQDFIDTCRTMDDLSVEQMVVTHMKENHDFDTITLGFVLGDDKTQVSLLLSHK